ncbi:hypothetical protein, partial [Streptomyces anthocyanicus]|uniref:hypothetical protein n=1 Tax=Streptomyces anthocyanicus TaxID=68174 RepID=UPI001C705C6A
MANLLKLTGRNICKFRADNEFNTMSITNWLAGDAAAGRNAIEAEITAAHSSFQNGGAERLSGVIQQKVKVLLNSSGVDSSYWNFAFNHAVFLH